MYNKDKKMNLKTCSHCKMTLSILEFHVKSRNKHGNIIRQSACISCAKHIRRAKALQNKIIAEDSPNYIIEINYNKELSQTELTKLETKFIGAVL